MVCRRLSVRLGAEELQARLGREPNPIVITEITESLAGLSDQQSVPGLRDLAERHPSPLVRSYVFMAVADIVGKAVIPYLQEQRRKERSNYVKAALDTVLFAKGKDEALSDLFKDLKSKDVKVRRLVANLLNTMHHEESGRLCSPLSTKHWSARRLPALAAILNEL